MVAVHARAAAGGEQHRLRLDEAERTGAHVDHQHAGQARSVGGRHQRDGAMLFEPVDLSSPDLLGQPIDDLNARQAAFMDSPIESLPGEGLLMHRAVGVAIEERSEEHTYELQSLMRISYAVFCL